MGVLIVVGFTKRALYLMLEYLRNKPVVLLIGDHLPAAAFILPVQMRRNTVQILKPTLDPRQSQRLFHRVRSSFRLARDGEPRQRSIFVSHRSRLLHGHHELAS